MLPVTLLSGVSSYNNQGDLVLALSKTPGRGWLMGVVVARCSNGKYTIAFSDGSEEEGIRFSYLKIYFTRITVFFYYYEYATRTRWVSCTMMHDAVTWFNELSSVSTCLKPDVLLSHRKLPNYHTLRA